MIFFWKNTNQTLVVFPLPCHRSDQTARTTAQIDMHIHNKYSNNCIALSPNRIALRAWKECLALKSSSICFLLFTPPLSLSLSRPFVRSLPSNVKTNKGPSKSILCVFQVDVSDGCRLLMAKKKRKKRKNDNSIVKGNEPEDNKRRERQTKRHRETQREREGKRPSATVRSF